jgi:hypothetical protein
LSLAQGDLGIALTHLAQGSPPTVVHTHLSTALASGVTDTTGRAGLFHGLPAVAFTLAHTPPGHYQQARVVVREHLRQMTAHRLDAAHHRIDRGDLTSFTEYDLVSGLTGVGVAVWAIDPHSSLLERVLSYLVRLTRPVRHDGRSYPGWWVHHGPLGRLDPGFPHGHANTGMAHGIGGILSFLALAYRSGRTVSGHREAMEHLCAALDKARCRDEAGIWWPRWVGTDGSRADVRPSPPSWCYGTPGLARAQQVAALALEDTTRQDEAEGAMDACMDGPDQIRRLAVGGLCHGPAGLLCTLMRMAEDQSPHAGRPRLDRHAAALREHVMTASVPHQGAGLLEGAGGTDLVLAPREHLTHPSWDRCLLLS